MDRESSPKCAGTFLLVHGLNIAPRAMDWIGAGLRAQGAKTIFAALSGHAEDLPRSMVSSQQWELEVVQAFQKLSQMPRPHRVLGYSLGGLLSALVVGKGMAAAPDALVLLAPAMGLRWWVRSFEFLTKILPPALPLPSGVPAKYRAARFAAVGWYSALFDLYHELHALPAGTPLSGTPISVFISPKDEFIGIDEIRNWQRAAELKHVAITPVPSLAKISLAPQHLVLEPAHFGEERWEAWISELMALQVAR